MCIIGYDNSKAGGAFYVQNSWGEDFGLGGRFWLRYSDIKNVVAEAWVMLPDNMNEKQYSPNNYSFNIKSDYEDHLSYGLFRSNDNSSWYEGFYSDNSTHQTWAFELFPDGSTYFGQFVNFIRDGNGIFLDNDGQIYKVTFMNGELISSVLGYSATPSQTLRALYDHTAAREPMNKDLAIPIKSYTQF